MDIHDTRPGLLGATGIAVDDVTVGTSGLGRGTRGGTTDERAALAAAAALLEGPFALVDTSNAYAEGRSEEVLGSARASLGERARARVVTKVDCDPATGAFDRDRVLRSYEQSLRRLRLDRVEVLHLHDPYTVSFQEAAGPSGAIEGLLELREAGAVDAIGIAAGPLGLVTRYVETGAFDVVLSHNRFTLVDRSAESLFTAARARGMGVFNAAPFGGGILSTGAREGASYAYRPASLELAAWVARAADVCTAHGTSLAAAALHFSLRSPLVDSTVVGVSSPARLAELVALRAEDVPDALWDALDDLGAAPSPLIEE